MLGDLGRRPQLRWLPDQGQTPHHDVTLTLLFLCCHPSVSAPCGWPSPFERSVGRRPRRSRMPSWFLKSRWLSAPVVPSRASRPTASDSTCRRRRSGPTATASYAHPLPRLQRELPDEFGHSVAPGRSDHRGHPAGQVAYRCPAGRPDGCGWLPGSPCRTTNVINGTPTRFRGGLTCERAPWSRANRSVSGAGGDQGCARRGAESAAEGAADPARSRLLERMSPGPVVTFNQVVAVAMVEGTPAGLAMLGTLDGDEGMARTHRIEAVRGHVLNLAGEWSRPVSAVSRRRG
jgi:hypothetical protein